jgi:hypothetical protein
MTTQRGDSIVYIECNPISHGGFHHNEICKEEVDEPAGTDLKSSIRCLERIRFPVLPFCIAENLTLQQFHTQSAINLKAVGAFGGSLRMAKCGSTKYRVTCMKALLEKSSRSYVVRWASMRMMW